MALRDVPLYTVSHAPLELPALSIVYSWVFVHIGGSALLAVLLHPACNLSTLNAAKAGLHDARVVALVVVLKWLAAAIALRWREARTPMRAGREQRA